MQIINSFRDEYYFLSNFYMVPVLYNGLTYANSESAFQAQKCQDLEGKFEFQCISGASAKAKGKKVKLNKPWWEENKYRIMLEIVWAKFSQNEDLDRKLLATGDALLIEGNTWKDKTWGVYRNKKGILIGRNALGNILMEVRERLRRYEM